MFNWSVFVGFIFLIFAIFYDWRDPPTVKIEEGELVGKRLYTKLGREFSAFLGIPYAKPPIGDLRFEV